MQIVPMILLRLGIIFFANGCFNAKQFALFEL